MHLPVSTATNAYELLEEVCELILEEPKRYFQGWWRITRDESVGMLSRHDLEYPACSTICCVAGWVCTMKKIDQLLAGFSVGAMRLLGLDSQEAFELFNSTALDTTARPQTIEYAQAGVNHIQAFMAKHETKLKAKDVSAHPL